MDPYDKEKTREIWKRVLGEDAAPAEIDAAALRQMIGEEKTAVCIYRALAKRGCRSETMRRIAAEELAHSRRLEALYFLWTGRRSGTVSAKLPRFSSLQDAFRHQHQAELAAAEGYRRAAAALPAHRELLLEIAGDEECHAQRLFRLLQQSLQ